MSLRIGDVFIFCKVSMIQSSKYPEITSTCWESDLLVGNTHAHILVQSYDFNPGCG